MFLSTSVAEKGNKKTNLYEVLTRYLPTIQFASNSGQLNQNKPQTSRMITSDHLSKINILH